MSQLLWLMMACSGSPPATDSGDATSGSSTSSTTAITETTDGLEAIDPADLPTAVSPCREPELVEITDIIDGDTARMNTRDGNRSVRFIGIDTPEIGYDGDPSDCFAEEARDLALEHLAGRRAWLTFDAECEDYYDRLLAYVHTDTTEQGFFQRVSLRGGYALPLPISPNTSFEELFEQDAQTAQDAGAGVWDACTR